MSNKFKVTFPTGQVSVYDTDSSLEDFSACYTHAKIEWLNPPEEKIAEKPVKAKKKVADG